MVARSVLANSPEVFLPITSSMDGNGAEENPCRGLVGPSGPVVLPIFGRGGGRCAPIQSSCRRRCPTITTEPVCHSAYNDWPLLGAAVRRRRRPLRLSPKIWGATWNTYGTGSCAGKRLPRDPRQRMPSFHYWLMFGMIKLNPRAVGFGRPRPASLCAGYSRDSTS
jgi:hypothetical protein